MSSIQFLSLLIKVKLVVQGRDLINNGYESLFNFHNVLDMYNFSIS